MIRLDAGSAGFFNVSPLGKALAPNALLRTGVNATGMIVLPSADGWVSAESLRYSDFGIGITARFTGTPPAFIGATTSLAVTEVRFYRIEGGIQVEAGSITLKKPLIIEARYDTYGANDALMWQADLGTALEDLVQVQGMRFTGSTGDDIFAPHMQALPMRGPMIASGGDGNDQLTGSYGDDKLRGGSGNDILSDASGTNLLLGGSGNDTLIMGQFSVGSTARGGSGDDFITSSRGDDFLFGDAGHDTLFGGSGNDILSGGSGRDTLDGGSGMDIIDGGRGKDLLTGGFDADIFQFRAGERGRDTITDFTSGEDHIAFDGVSGFDALSISQRGQDAFITWGTRGASISLSDFDATLLSADDFIF